MPSVETMTLQEQVLDTQVGITTQEEVEIRQNVLNEKKNIESAFIRMARYLSEINHRELYIGWGFPSFETYVKSELDYSYRKASYLVQVWDRMKFLRIDANRLENIGWTKAAGMANVVTPDNVDLWMDRAENLSYRDLVDEVRKVVDSSYNDDRPTFTVMKIRFDQADMTPVNDALDEAKKIYETGATSVAMAMICADWLNAKGAAPERSTVDDYIRFIYKTFNVALAPVQIEKVATPEAYGVTQKDLDKMKVKKEKAAIQETNNDVDIDDILKESDTAPKQPVNYTSAEMDEFLDQL